jgi:hypothetical protein
VQGASRGKMRIFPCTDTKLNIAITVATHAKRRGRPQEIVRGVLVLKHRKLGAGLFWLSLKNRFSIERPGIEIYTSAGSGSGIDVRKIARFFAHLI